MTHLEADGSVRRVVARTGRPNGLAVDGRGEDGIRADGAAPPYDGRVFRVDPATLGVTTLDAGLRFTNGLAFDADGDLYVDETVTGAVYRYRLSRSLAYRENFANVLDPALTPRHRGPDGMAFDTEGRLYCAVFGQGDVTVIAPDGTIERRIPVGGARRTNVAFAHDGPPRIVVTEVEQGAVEMHDVPAGGLGLHAP